MKGMDWAPEFAVDGQTESTAGNIRSTPASWVRREFELPAAVRVLGGSAGEAVFEVGSGTYRFSVAER